MLFSVLKTTGHLRHFTSFKLMPFLSGYLQLPLQQWGAGNVYLLVLSSWKQKLLRFKTVNQKIGSIYLKLVLFQKLFVFNKEKRESIHSKLITLMMFLSRNSVVSKALSVIKEPTAHPPAFEISWRGGVMVKLSIFRTITVS